jgi:hypothetical protein
MSRKPFTEEQLVKAAMELGYQLKKVRELERKTFVVEKDTLMAFLEAREKAGVKMQDAVTEALADWTKKKR